MIDRNGNNTLLIFLVSTHNIIFCTGFVVLDGIFTIFNDNFTIAYLLFLFNLTIYHHS